MRHAKVQGKKLSCFFHQLLHACRARHDPDDASDTSIVAHLLRLRDPATGQPLPDDLLASQIGVLFWAGHDTTGNTIAYALYLVSQYPEAQCRLEAELDAAQLLVTPWRPVPREMAFEDLPRLPYLQAVVREAMRMYPVAPIVSRVSEQDVQLGGHLIPAGTMLQCAIASVQRCHFEDGANFRPERWLEDPQAHLCAPTTGLTASPPAPAPAVAANELHAPVASNAVKGAAEVSRSATPQRKFKRFLPFADGPRDCVGQNLAQVSVPATLLQLLRHFEFKLDPGYDHSTVCNTGLIMTPPHGMPMYCIPRGSEKKE